MRYVSRTLPTARRSANALMLFTALIALAALGAGSCTTTSRNSAFAVVDGHAVAYRVLGSGKPVVVMISGLGDGMESFEDVAPEIAKFATVVVYDRAGYGGSAAAPGPRDAEAVDRELSGLLAQIGVRGPYVVLGHSSGGLCAEYIAAKHGNQVAGLILAESRPADFTRRCEAAEAGPCAAPALLVRLMPKGARDEFNALAAAAAQVEGAGPIAGRLVMILSRAVQPKPAPFDAVWATSQNDLTARYAGSRHVVAKRAGHYLHHDESAWFVAAVAQFVKPEGQAH